MGVYESGNTKRAKLYHARGRYQVNKDDHRYAAAVQA
jgi:hypothetical protein